MDLSNSGVDDAQGPQAPKLQVASIDIHIIKRHVKTEHWIPTYSRKSKKTHEIDKTMWGERRIIFRG